MPTSAICKPPLIGMYFYLNRHNNLNVSEHILNGCLVGEHAVSNFSQSSTWCVVNVLENGNTTPNHCIFSSLYVKVDVHMLPHKACQIGYFSHGLQLQRNSVTTSESMTTEQVAPLSFRELILDHLHIVRAL